MKQGIVTRICLVLLAVSSVQAQGQEGDRSPPAIQLLWDVTFFGAGIWVEQSTGRPTPSESFVTDSLDRSFHRHLDSIWGSGAYGTGKKGDLPGRLSDVTLVGLYGAALAGPIRDEDGDDAWMVVHGAALNDFVTKSLKASFARPRPYATMTAKDPDDGYRSFPSGHASHAFQAALMCQLQDHGCGDYAGWMWAGAAMTGYLRIAANKHHLVDVVAGAAIGAATATITHKVFHRPKKSSEAVGAAAPSMVVWEQRW